MGYKTNSKMLDEEETTDNSKMEEIQESSHSPSLWCSMQALTLWDKDDSQKGEELANEHLNDSEEAWENVMLSAETIVELFGINPTRCVRRQREMNKNTLLTVKLGGGNILLWAVYR